MIASDRLLRSAFGEKPIDPMIICDALLLSYNAQCSESHTRECSSIACMAPHPSHMPDTDSCLTLNKQKLKYQEKYL